jgi:serine/threonine protein kinase
MDLEEEKKEPAQDKKEENKLNITLSIQDFKFLGELGKGSFGKVHLVEREGKKYALKEISKSFILNVSH